MTQNKSKYLALLVLTLLFNIELRAQSVHFNYGNGTNASYNLSDLHKITFDADLMNMHLFDGSVFSWPIANVIYHLIITA